MSGIGGVNPAANRAITLNGTAIGAATVAAIPSKDLDATRKRLSQDHQDHIYFTNPSVCLPDSSGGVVTCVHPTFVATGKSLNLHTFERNILMVDHQRMNLIAVDNAIQGAGEATHRVLAHLPNISSNATVGIVSVGAVGTALAMGVRSPKSLIVTGLVAAGVAGAAAVGLSFYRAKHPGTLPDWLK